MQFELVQMEELSGVKAKIYSILLEGDDRTLLEQFVLNNSAYATDVTTMLQKLSLMGHQMGCKEHYFKDKEGAPGDGMVALRYKQMRLYCLRFDNTCIFVGSGGFKPAGIAAYQQDEELNKSAQQMKRICASINNAIIEKDLLVLADGSIETTDFINLVL